MDDPVRAVVAVRVAAGLGCLAGRVAALAAAASKVGDSATAGPAVGQCRAGLGEAGTAHSASPPAFAPRAGRGMGSLVGLVGLVDRARVRPDRAGDLGAESASGRMARAAPRVDDGHGSRVRPTCARARLARRAGDHRIRAHPDRGRGSRVRRNADRGRTAGPEHRPSGGMTAHRHIEDPRHRRWRRGRSSSPADGPWRRRSRLAGPLAGCSSPLRGGRPSNGSSSTRPPSGSRSSRSRGAR